MVNVNLPHTNQNGTLALAKKTTARSYGKVQITKISDTGYTIPHHEGASAQLRAENRTVTQIVKDNVKHGIRAGTKQRDEKIVGRQLFCLFCNPGR